QRFAQRHLEVEPADEGTADRVMTDHNSSPHFTALQELEAALEAHRRAQAPAGPASAHIAIASRVARLWSSIPMPAWRLRAPAWRFPSSFPSHPLLLIDRRHPLIRKAAIALAGVVVLVLVAGGALWWRLSSGPIALDLATPWLTSAIEQNLGSRYRVQVGGTL